MQDPFEQAEIAHYSESERRQFREALQDLSEKMTAVAMTL